MKDARDKRLLIIFLNDHVDSRESFDEISIKNSLHKWIIKCRLTVINVD